jgi:multidrug efflux pump subunit AcrA (membrane-fusion protein)
MPAISPIHGGEIGKIRSFLMDHEKLLIVVIAAVLIFAGYVKVTNIIAAHDKAQLQQAQIVANAQAAANAQLAQQAAVNAKQIEEDKAQLQVLSDKLTAQNQQLVNANTALATALTKQQKTDASLPVPALVDRWAQLAPGTNFTGAIGSGNNVEVTPSNALATVQQLERVPVLTTQLANETTEKTNDDQLIAQQNKNLFDLNGQVGTLNASIVGLNKQIVDNSAVCQDQIKVVKAEAAKSKRRWFIIGFVTGFISRQLLISKGL